MRKYEISFAIQIKMQISIRKEIVNSSSTEQFELKLYFHKKDMID